MPNSFDYVVIRVVPLVEREEFFNAGVIVFCPQQRYLEARTHLDAAKLHAFAANADAGEIARRLAAIERICAGDEEAGPIARLSQRARFHWLSAPRSTVIQVSPVHCGECEEPRPVLDRLFREHVLRP